MVAAIVGPGFSHLATDVFIQWVQSFLTSDNPMSKGLRKLMDYFPNLFTQRELSWLDDVIPHEVHNKNSNRKKLSNQRVSLTPLDQSRE